MAEELRRQVSKVYGDLLEAVDRLEQVETINSNEVGTSRRSTIQVHKEQSAGESPVPCVQQPVPIGPRREHVRQTGRSTLPVLPPMNTTSSQLGRLFNFKPSLKGKDSKPRSKKKKLQMWTHTFVCLAKVDQDQAPDSRERAQLKMAGLGEKRCSIFLYAEAEELQDALTDEFPKLSRGGGFELLRQTGNSLLLEAIPSPKNGYTVEYLKAVVSNAKIYVRPMQRGLDIEALEVSGTCI